jgi:hypothetical protein
MLSRTQPRPAGQPTLPLDAIQNPIVDAYLAALPAGVEPGSSPRVPPSSPTARSTLQVAEPGYASRQPSIAPPAMKLLVTLSPNFYRSLTPTLATAHVAALARDSVLRRVTDISFQVHSVEPSHRDTLRSIELIAQHMPLSYDKESP